jgi:hypothetical protein
LPLTTVPLNPGSGGASVAVIQQPDGSDMPVSGLAVSVDGTATAQPITSANAFPMQSQSVEALLIEQNRILRCVVRGLSILADVDLNEGFYEA